jgi:formate dehydrogenase major subunit
MSYQRLEELGGIQWPCWDENDPGASFLHGRLWEDPPTQGALAPFSVVEHDPPVDEVSDEFPLLLTTGRRLDAFNTGVQTGGYASPLDRGEELELSREDADELGVRTGDTVRVSSRRGSIDSPVRVQPALRPGLAFMTFHVPDPVETNILTVNAVDPKSGTAEFKATAIRVDRVSDGEGAAAARTLETAGAD